MTVLAALVQLYERMQAAGEAPPPGFSAEKISFAIELDADGSARLSDRRSFAGKKPEPVMMNVPAGPEGRRGTNLAPGYFWDPSPYALGVSVNDNKEISLTADRAEEKYKSFREHNLAVLQDATDAGLCAFREFLNRWEPADFEQLGFNKEALNTNIIFEFRSADRYTPIYKSAAAISLLPDGSSGERGLCLVTGKDAPIARLHPAIKGVMGAQSSGSALVSFNTRACESFGKSQGKNAPVSERAAFAYGAALNALLARQKAGELERHIRIGDTTVAFWVNVPKTQAAGHMEMLLGTAINPPNEPGERQKLRAALMDMAMGRATDPKLDPGATVYILGLAPNAARLSVRYWHQGRFGDFARNMLDFWEDLHIEGNPDDPPWQGPPAVWSLLYETAIRAGGKPKAETIRPLLGGEVMRAILMGRPLPRSLLSAVIGRIRADGDVGGRGGRRVAICKAVINRALKTPTRPTGSGGCSLCLSMRSALRFPISKPLSRTAIFLRPRRPLRASFRFWSRTLHIILPY